MIVSEIYTFHCDPGHAWLEVTREELDALGISSMISRYSYESEGDVYLEEDCDASVFEYAFENMYGHKPSYIEQTHGSDCFIRKLNKYVW